MFLSESIKAAYLSPLVGYYDKRHNSRQCDTVSLFQAIFRIDSEYPDMYVFHTGSLMFCRAREAMVAISIYTTSETLEIN
jgi:hypothetical protein